MSVDGDSSFTGNPVANKVLRIKRVVSVLVFALNAQGRGRAVALVGSTGVAYAARRSKGRLSTRLCEIPR
jgi:hypothetical protein